MLETLSNYPNSDGRQWKTLYWQQSATMPIHFFSVALVLEVFFPQRLKKEKSNQLRGPSQHYKPRFEAKAYLKIGQKDKSIRLTLNLMALQSNQSIVNYMIEMTTMVKYKTINLKVLIKNNFCLLQNLHINIYNFITSFSVLHVRVLKHSFGLICLFRFSDWWRFLCRIMGNVCFSPGIPL